MQNHLRTIINNFHYLSSGEPTYKIQCVNMIPDNLYLFRRRGLNMNYSSAESNFDDLRKLRRHKITKAIYPVVATTKLNGHKFLSYIKKRLQLKISQET